eukprot:364919-Chlamydomonas_euryale.AAC.2
MHRRIRTWVRPHTWARASKVHGHMPVHGLAVVYRLKTQRRSVQSYSSILKNMLLRSTGIRAFMGHRA